MAILKLRNHIPISAPARREEADGTESDMRVSLGFEPKWFHERCGVDFSEKWHIDPFCRHDTLERMKKELMHAFPTVSYWDLCREEDLATLSGCYGAYVVPWVFGIALRYASDRWPVPDREKPLSVEEIENLDAPTLLSGPCVEELLGQMDIIGRTWGKIHGFLNWQGVLNNAFHLRKQELFIDLMDRPEFVHRMFGLVTEVMIGLARMVQERQRASGFHIDHFVVSNCTVNMISPDAYREFVFPYDLRIARSFGRFGVHTCNWDVTPYIEVLKPLPGVGYLDMGIMTDMARVKKEFPQARRAVLYNPNLLEEAEIGTIRRDMERVHENLAPCDVVMADITHTTPDSRVNELLAICRELESREWSG